MSKKNSERDSRYFTGDERELQALKNKASMQKIKKRLQRRKRFAKFLFASGIAALIAIFIMICFAVFFRVENIEVVSSGRYTKEQILSLTDIEEGMSIFRASDRDLKSLYGNLAYVSDARIVRKLPDTIIIEISEEKGVYMSELYGEFFVLSDDMRVIDRVFDRETLSDEGLIELVFPDINSAIVGYGVEFEDDITAEYVAAYLDALEASPMMRKATAFDLRDRFSLAMIADGKYLIDFGSGDELATKLTVVAGILEDPYFDDGLPATIGATDPAECHVIKNQNVTVAFE